MSYAAALYGASEGLFDITSGVLRKAWDFRRPSVPKAEVLEPLLALVGWDKVACEGEDVYLREAGMEIEAHHSPLRASTRGTAEEAVGAGHGVY